MSCPYSQTDGPGPRARSNLAGAPVYDADLFADEFIQKPWGHYAAMRDIGPVVWLPVHGAYAITRYAEVRRALHNWQTYSSAQGVAGDDAGCAFLRGNTLASDPPFHDELRKAMAPPLYPAALQAVRPRMAATIRAVIEQLTTHDSFDGMVDLARVLPVNVVRDLVGLPEDGRGNMLTWGAASFDIQGVQNARGRKGLELVKEMRAWIADALAADRFSPGSWTARIQKLVKSGQIPPEFGPQLIRDYINPSLDTTISATGQLLYQLARNPDQFDRLKRDPHLIPNAVDEAVRLGSPIRLFSRTLTADAQIGGISLPAGARAYMMFAAANRDERHYADADRFDVSRPAADHLGFGHGIHMCVGMHLAKMEMELIAEALVEGVERIEAGEPVVALNNTIYSFAQLPLRFVAAKARPASQIASTITASRPGWIEARVLGRVEVAEDVISFRLGAADGSLLPAFEAGAHIDVDLGDGLVRQYSLCGNPGRQDEYRLGVLRESQSRGGSEAMHERLDRGSTVWIGVPRNLFALEEEAGRSILIAGGIGVTPILAMAYRLCALQRPFELHYATRTRSRAAFVDEIAALVPDALFYFGDVAESRRFDAARVLAAPSDELHFYCCGPVGLIDDVVATAARQGWNPKNVHIERFAAQHVDAGAPFVVHARRSGRSFPVPVGRTILEVLQEAGIAVPRSCEAGVCGVCLTPVIQGDPDHRDMVLTDAEKASNMQIAVCCSRSCSADLILDI